MKIKNLIKRISLSYRAKAGVFAGKNSAVVCPCCKWRGRKFLAVGGRDNALCPNCGSFERHRLYYLYLKQVLPADRKIKILHFAPEKIIAGLFKSYPQAEYLSVDIDPKAAMMPADITALQFPDNSYDVIFCSHVLEHIIYDRLAMKELLRVLKPEGFAVIQVPIKDYFQGRRIERTYEDPNIVLPQDRQQFFGQSDHVRIYGRDYGERLTAAGFQLEIIRFADSFSPQDIKKFGLLPEDESGTEAEGWIYKCTKQ